VKTDGGPAFPSGEYVEGRREDGTPVKLARYPGMTLRQWYAGMAMQGYLASGDKQAFNTAEVTAEWAFDQADAMLSQDADE